MSHAWLTVHERRLLIRRVVVEDRPAAQVVKELGCSRATGYEWLARWRLEGEAGPADRSSRPAPLLGLPAPSLHAVLSRHGLHRLA